MPATRVLLLLAATSTLCTQCAANDPASYEERMAYGCSSK